MTKTKNVSAAEHCAACVDGWVELAGTTTIGGETYTHGMAPCKWCELGDRRYIHATDPAKPGGRWEPQSDFDGGDIVTPGAPGRKFTPDADFLRERIAAGNKREALQAMFPRRIWPPEWAEPEPGGDRLGALTAAVIKPASKETA